MRITIACPEAVRSDANALARCLGLEGAAVITALGLQWVEIGE